MASFTSLFSYNNSLLLKKIPSFFHKNCQLSSSSRVFQESRKGSSTTMHAMIPRRLIVETHKYMIDSFPFDEYMAKMAERVNQVLDDEEDLGNRVIPALCIASCGLVGGDEEIAYPIACALEMIHTKSINIDDEEAILALAFELCNVDAKHVGNKTAVLLEAALVGGAIMGGGRPTDVERLRKYSKYIISLFQATNSKAFADELVEQAHNELSCYDVEKAAPLYHLANYLAEQNTKQTFKRPSIGANVAITDYVARMWR